MGEVWFYMRAEMSKREGFSGDLIPATIGLLSFCFNFFALSLFDFYGEYERHYFSAVV